DHYRLGSDCTKTLRETEQVFVLLLAHRKTRKRRSALRDIVEIIAQEGAMRATPSRDLTGKRLSTKRRQMWRNSNSLCGGEKKGEKKGGERRQQSLARPGLDESPLSKNN
ncbi:hypothetical protein GBF38_009088, partial [Nibea albiflora]